MRKVTVTLNRQALTQLVLNHCAPFDKGTRVESSIYVQEEGKDDEYLPADWFSFTFAAPDAEPEPDA